MTTPCQISDAPTPTFWRLLACRCRPPSISLRTFLLALTGAGILLGITAERAREQRKGVLATQRLGGVIVYDTMRDELRKWNAQNSAPARSRTPPHYSLKTQLSESEIAVKDSLIRRMLGNDLFDRVVAVDLHNCNFAGEQLAHLSGFPQLEELYLSSTNITDEDLAYLSGLSNLRILTLRSTEITDSGIEHLLNLKRLQSLSLGYTHVTKHGVRKLRQAIPGCKITQRSHYRPKTVKQSYPSDQQARHSTSRAERHSHLTR